MRLPFLRVVRIFVTIDGTRCDRIANAEELETAILHRLRHTINELRVIYRTLIG